MIKIKNVLYNDIDTEIEKLYENEFENEYVVVQDEESLGKDYILAETTAWRVTDKNLIFVEGIYYNYEGVNKYNPDFSLTLIYENVKDDRQFDINKYLYFEQDSPMTAVHNFLNIVDGGVIKW